VDHVHDLPDVGLRILAPPDQSLLLWQRYQGRYTGYRFKY
jgi:hypothetical protein